MFRKRLSCVKKMWLKYFVCGSGKFVLFKSYSDSFKLGPNMPNSAYFGSKEVEFGQTRSVDDLCLYFFLPDNRCVLVNILAIIYPLSAGVLSHMTTLGIRFSLEQRAPS